MRVKSVIKKLLPAFALDAFRRARTERAMRHLLQGWDAAVGQLQPRKVDPSLKRLLIVPCDPNTLTGSLGDDAMMSAFIQAAQTKNPNVEIYALTASAAASAEARRRGYIAKEIWYVEDFPQTLANLLNQRSFDAVAALGADILDGYYDPVSAAQTLAICDLAARSGVPTTVLGFSFNSKPSPLLRPVFARLHAGVKLHVRDAISLDRLRAFSDVPATLVADAAFMLVAGKPPAEAVAWVDEQRGAGRCVIGINIHPLLIKHATPAQIDLIVQRTTDALRQVAGRRAVAWLLLPHDYRGENGDGRCLAPIAARLAPDLGDRVMMLTGEHGAAVLKGVAALLDGVLSGRMHLAIASIGKGVPTLCVTYQGKFEGLYRHFDLPDWLLMTPEQMLSAGVLEERLIRLIDENDALRDVIHEGLPTVLSLSRENFSIFASSSAEAVD